VVGGALLAALGGAQARAQGFAGLGSDADGFAAVVPGRALVFPRDHGPHPDYRIEWWYLTANLADAAGVAYGAQWTLFRQALFAAPPADGWASNQIWLGHAAVTRADLHRTTERLARGGVGQAGAQAAPFEAWIDAWEMRGLAPMSDTMIAPLRVAASGADFSYDLQLVADRPLVLQGEAGYSRKSERGQASYYYSQPYFTATGSITLDGRPVQVSGRAWMDREWSSQPLAPDQSGWDWVSLHLESGDKLMLYRLRQTDGPAYLAGNWIGRDGVAQPLDAASVAMTPTARTTIAGREVPTQWRIEIASRQLRIDTLPLNPRSWMGTQIPYWEGPISCRGSHPGIGYLEMTGY
jgi:predicted secreted hydrolase